MKIKELIEELKGYDQELDIDLVVSVPPNCDCRKRGNYCYCSYRDEHYYSLSVSERTVYNRKTKKHDIVGISIQGD